jgi:hypothetical protein
MILAARSDVFVAKPGRRPRSGGRLARWPRSQGWKPDARRRASGPPDASGYILSIQKVPMLPLRESTIVPSIRPFRTIRPL